MTESAGIIYKLLRKSLPLHASDIERATRLTKGRVRYALTHDDRFLQQANSKWTVKPRATTKPS